MNLMTSGQRQVAPRAAGTSEKIVEEAIKNAQSAYRSINQYLQESSLTPADKMLASSIKSAAGLASLAQIPSSEIPASKSALNALAVEYEEQILELSMMVKTMAPLVKQAHDLKSLWTRDGFPTLSGLFLDQLANEPGAYKFFLDNGFSQFSEAFAAPIRQQMVEQQQAQGQL